MQFQNFTALVVVLCWAFHEAIGAKQTIEGDLHSHRDSMSAFDKVSSLAAFPFPIASSMPPLQLYQKPGVGIDARRQRRLSSLADNNNT